MPTIPAGSTNVSLMGFRAMSTAGAPLTSLVAADLTAWYRRDGAKVTVTLSDLAALTTGHTDGGVKHIGDGFYRIDYPDAAFADGVDSVGVGGTAAGGVLLSAPVTLTETPPGGSNTVTITVNDGTDPIQNATVLLKSGSTIIDRQQTNASGVATLTADDGTYSRVVTKAGYESDTDTLVVNGATTPPPVSLTAIGSTPSTEPDSVTVRWRVMSSDTREPVGASDATVYLRIRHVGEAGHAWETAWDSQATDANGYAEFPNVPLGATVDVKLEETGKVFRVVIPSDAESPYDADPIYGYIGA